MTKKINTVVGRGKSDEIISISLREKLKFT